MFLIDNLKMSKNEEQTKRGFQWTEEERDSIKPLKRKLEKQFNSISSMIKGLPNAMPEFAVVAEIYGNPFLESAKEIITLDSRRKGKKWQHIPFSSLPKKLSKISELYLEYQNCLLAREDFQKALKEHNKNVQRKNREILKIEKKIIEDCINNNLDYLNKIRNDKELLGKSIKNLFDSFKAGALIKLNSISKLSDLEMKYLESWLVIQFIDVSCGLSSTILKYVNQYISNIENPTELLTETHLLLIESRINYYAQKLRKFGYSQFFIKTDKIMDLTYEVILNTILYRLDKILADNQEVLPSQLDFTLLEKSFSN